MADHVDAAPYAERSDKLDELVQSASAERRGEGMRLQWTCPICLGPPQVDDVRKRVIFGLDGSTKVSVVCHCGYLHSDKQGCGYGAEVTVPASEIGEGTA